MGLQVLTQTLATQFSLSSPNDISLYRQFQQIEDWESSQGHYEVLAILESINSYPKGHGTGINRAHTKISCWDIVNENHLSRFQKLG